MNEAENAKTRAGKRERKMRVEIEDGVNAYFFVADELDCNGY